MNIWDTTEGIAKIKQFRYRHIIIQKHEEGHHKYDDIEYEGTVGDSYVIKMIALALYKNEVPLSIQTSEISINHEDRYLFSEYRHDTHRGTITIDIHFEPIIINF